MTAPQERPVAGDGLDRNGTKQCRSCGQVKRLTEFRRDSNRPDGRRARCTDCLRVDGQRYRSQIEPSRRNEWQRSYRERHPDRIAEQRRRFRAQNPDKNRAHDLVFKAIKRGELVRPETCEWCSATGRIEATHGDYSRPLDVIWLCVLCHRARDRGDVRLRTEGGAS